MPPLTLFVLGFSNRPIPDFSSQDFSRWRSRTTRNDAFEASSCRFQKFGARVTVRALPATQMRRIRRKEFSHRYRLIHTDKAGKCDHLSYQCVSVIPPIEICAGREELRAEKTPSSFPELGCGRSSRHVHPWLKILLFCEDFNRLQCKEYHRLQKRSSGSRCHAVHSVIARFERFLGLDAVSLAHES